MTSIECLAYIVNEIHSTVFATVDKHGNPITCAIDIMDYDEKGLYFLTARGKSFYDRLKNHFLIAFTGMKGQDTLKHCGFCAGKGTGNRFRQIGFSV